MEEGLQGKKCKWCQEQLKKMRMVGLLLQWNNSTSYGLVDGYQHLVEGKVRFDHAMHANPDDKKLSDDALSDFLLIFNIKLTSIDNMEETM